ncbi:phosphoribosylglycinamide formyltransferase [Xanthomonas sp. BRIP62418]|uniref:phosphoribosylglycinamide formyltransferase n=1 Tax=Xanthomonas sp. BRIP62418 TaxID=2182391 RepID=UPI000F8EAEE2|nr:phosphoribosylglycinamide formyltransferase [Xanthomonas sp. BRIP62418]
MSLRLAVLASGRGSNLQAILDAIASGRLPAEVVGVFSDRPQAPALHKVDEALRWSASPRDFADRAAFDAALGDAIAAARPDWVICAGYMRILGEPLVRRFAGRMLNIHPSLLPKYRGLHTHARALEAGDAEHGASVHLVVPELDAGTVIAQARVPVLPDDSAEQLAARVLAREHPLLLATLDLLASGRVQVRGDGVHIDGQCLFTPLRLESADTALA